MISSRIWRCTVTFSIGTSASTRPSKLRGIQSAELMNTLAWSDGSRLPLPKQTMRPCSRKRPTMLLTRIFSDMPGHARAQAADAADHKVDADAGLRGLVQQVDDRRVDQRVHLGPDLRRPAGAGMGDLGLDQLG